MEAGTRGQEALRRKYDCLLLRGIRLTGSVIFRFSNQQEVGLPKSERCMKSTICGR
jgi:hypothetical protein